MSNKLVSIIIPLYNAEKYIKDALDSVLSQSYSNWQCIIVDDGSTDSSKIIALEYCKKDVRFRYYYQSNSGPSAARNHGLKIATGDYIQYLDADDVILPERLDLMLEQSEKLEQNVILYSGILLGNCDNIYKTENYKFSVEIGRDITFDDMYSKFALDFLFIPHCLLFPRSAICNVKWNENLSYSEDWDYYLGVLKNKFVFRHLPIPLVIYRNSPEGLSKNKVKTYKANFRILEKWVQNQNLLVFTKRSALLYKKCIILFLRKKSDALIKPQFHYKNISFKKRLYIFLIYPLATVYLLQEIAGLMIKKIIRI